MMIKRFLRGALKRFGVVAFKRSSRVYIPEEETYRIVSTFAGCLILWSLTAGRILATW